MSAFACALPTGSTPEAPVAVEEVPSAEATPVELQPTPTLTEPAPDVSYEGVSFSYDDAIATDVIAQIVPLEERPEDVPFGGGTIPQHYRFEFVGYPHLPYPSSNAYMEIYPVAEFEAGHPDAAERIVALRDLLAARPATPELGSIPVMPLAPLMSAFYAQVEYLDFEGGSGVRCLTMFGFAVQPVTNSELRYTFQGFVGDGTYYVAAHMPVSTPILAEDIEHVTDVDVQALMAAELDWVAYLADKTAQLDAQPLESYTPSLAALDAMVQSISIQSE
jgi:hypothetical protein